MGSIDPDNLSTGSNDAQKEFELFAIDMSQTDKTTIVKQLMSQMSNVGFCLLTNVPNFNEEKLGAAIKAYHDLPLETKMQMAPKHHNPQSKHLYRGYFPFPVGDIANKEMLICGRPIEDISPWEREGCPLYEANPWTESFNSEHAWIKETFENHFKIQHDLALTLIRCFAIGLGKR